MVGLTADEKCRFEAVNMTKAFFTGSEIKLGADEGDYRVRVRIVPGEPDSVEVVIKSDGGTAEASEFAEHNMHLGAPDYDLALGRAFYRAASGLLKKQLPWGILTGVRPAKLFAGLAAEFGEPEAERIFEESFFVSPNKTMLCRMTAGNREKSGAAASEDECSIYVSIPYCPGRCAYCSFSSQDSDRYTPQDLETYFGLLEDEIGEMFGHIEKAGKKPVTAYIGGGTPAVLEARMLQRLLILLTRGREFREITLELGRPDVISPDKLRAVASVCSPRISINPQTLHDNVLKAIGRRHTVREFYDAFSMARGCGFSNINTDLIAGLPGDTGEGFIASVRGTAELAPESVTVHSYSKKRASKLAASGEADEALRNAFGEEVYDECASALLTGGYSPYYLYRQKDISGGNENVGWCRAGMYGLYNIYMMDELHSIYGCGAGAVTKLVSDGGRRITRYFNRRLPLEYIKQYGEMRVKKADFLAENDIESPEPRTPAQA